MYGMSVKRRAHTIAHRLGQACTCARVQTKEGPLLPIFMLPSLLSSHSFQRLLLPASSIFTIPSFNTMQKCFECFRLDLHPHSCLAHLFSIRAQPLRLRPELLQKHQLESPCLRICDINQTIGSNKDGNNSVLLLFFVLTITHRLY